MTPPEIADAIQQRTLLPWDDNTVEHNVRELAHAKDLVEAARELVAAIEAALVKQLPKGIVTVEGVGTVERKAGAKRVQWDDALLAPALARRALEDRAPDPVTGEIEDPVEAVVAAFTAAARFGWRSTALRALGVDPDQYSAVEYGRPTVILRQNVDEVAA